MKNKSRTISLRFFLYDFIRITAAIPGLIWFRPKVRYATETAKTQLRGGALMISNHITLFDPMYIMIGIWRRRHHFIAAKELLNNKFNKFLFTKVFLCIPIDRENFGISTFRDITSHLSDGELVTMFPEGHVNTGNGEIAAFKSGMVLMALKSGCPIVPVYIKKEKRVFSRLYISVGAPINVAETVGKAAPSMREIDEVAATLLEKEKELEKMV